MTVPSTMADLSVSEASNSPAGGETIKPNLDNYLRITQAILRRTNAKGSNIASASTVNIGASADGDFIDVTGTTTITAFDTVAAGIFRVVRFTGALTLTHNATSLILPTGGNITTVAGDIAGFRSLGSGNWVCEFYTGSQIAYTGKANTFTQEQVINVTTSEPFEVRSSATGVNVNNDFVAAGVGSNSYIRQIVAGSNFGVFQQLYNNGANAGWAVASNNGGTTQSYGGATFYTVNTALRHDWTVGSGQVFSINFNGGDSLYTSNDGTYTYWYSTGAIARLGSSTNNTEIIGNNTICGIAKTNQFDAYGGLRMAASYDSAGNLTAYTNTSGALSGANSRIALGKYRVPFSSLGSYIAVPMVVNTADLRIRIYAKTSTYCEVWIQDYNTTAFVDSAFDIIFSF